MSEPRNPSQPDGNAPQKPSGDARDRLTELRKQALRESRGRESGSSAPRAADGPSQAPRSQPSRPQKPRSQASPPVADPSQPPRAPAVPASGRAGGPSRRSKLAGSAAVPPGNPPANPSRRSGPQRTRPAASRPRDAAAPPSVGGSSVVGGTLRQLGDFVIEKELGRGGMGVVFRARQESMGRTVALKILPSIAGMDSSSVARFHREAEAAGRLSHPGIVPVFAVGEVDGIHYFAMELVEGPPLDAVIEPLRAGMVESLRLSLIEEAQLGDRLPSLRRAPGLETAGNRYVRSCVGLMADVANALGAAHAGNVIHRDIKPSNILLHPSGRPVLVDFGLARDELGVGFTQSGDALGTPSYMAPEQASGSKHIDARVDIYGLGATLYELLTLRPPFEGANAAEIMRQIVDDEPPRVRKLNPKVPAPLETIVHRCLAKDPDERYASIEAVEMDLRLFLSGHAITAENDSAWRRLRAFYRRQRRAVLTAAATLAIVSLGVVGVGIVRSDRAEADGRAALAKGVEWMASDVSAAIGEFARAQSLMAPELWERLLTEHVEQTVDAQYGAQPTEAARAEATARLIELFDWLPESVRAALPEHAARVRGIGFLSVRGVGSATVSVAARAGADGLGSSGRTYTEHRPDQPLSIGDYVVRVVTEDGREAIGTASIPRDRRVEWTPRPIAPDLLAEDWRPVFGPSGAAEWTLARYELSQREYQEVLDRLPPELAGPLSGPLSGGSDPDRVDLPVIDLSFAQARLVAALSGAHLPTAAELEWAGTGGLDPQRWPYPWGATLRPAVLAADANRFSEPMAVTSLPEGEGLFGHRHLLGNAAEICAKSLRGELFAFGGHFQSEQATLRFGSPTLRLSLEHPRATHPKAGLRLARCLPLPYDADAERAAEAVWTEWDRDGRLPSWRHLWRVEAPMGLVRHDHVVRWFPNERASGQSSGQLKVESPGFVRVMPESATVSDGHDRELHVRWEALAPDWHLAHVDFGRELKANQAVRLTARSTLQPTTGLSMDGDALTFRMPMPPSRIGRTAHRLSLPPGSRIDVISPEPDQRFVTKEGRQDLIWVLPSDSQRTVAATVRFRFDGLLTQAWPSADRIASTVDGFFACLQHRTGVGEALHHDYQQEPEGISRSTVLGGELLPTFAGWRIRDVTAVGNVALVELDVDWKPVDAQEPVSGWPMQLFLMRDGLGAPWQAHRLRPRSRVDTGQIDERGRYRHQALGVEIQPHEQFELNRAQRFVPSMQVGYDLGRSRRMYVFGMRVGADERANDTTLLARLTSGASAMLGHVERPAWLTIRRGEGELVPIRSEVLEIPGERGAWHAVGWALFRAGTRALVVECRVRGSSKDDAWRVFEQTLPEFRAIAGRIRVLDS